ncbi:hypothetical protein BDV3_000872 [Batrachochytrium dendrobatidis]|uniref:Macro domain-containing protein n=1 Tax=Batrachochytrium dendrobatidis (strain JEL423) TaxID=403673 RepID=A0A177W7Z2_BATDL|nr:hypothetical protein BDEG_20424 [Batrachochytrium dendrobatidis JEL423]
MALHGARSVASWKQRLASKTLECMTRGFGPAHTPHGQVCIFRGDITELPVDAIVNAANNSLLGGGGVDGAIHRKAGRELLEECIKLDGCPTGQAKLTRGYNLPSPHVIHTVGPIIRGNQLQPNVLASCYTASLNVAKHNQIKSIAFPCISTGIYGYDQDSAAHVALGTVRQWLMENTDTVDLVIFCVFLEEDYQIYSRLIPEYFTGIKNDSSSTPDR